MPRAKPQKSHLASEVPQQQLPWKLAGAAALVILTVWLWSPTLQFGFVYDDHAQIETNSHVQSWNYLAQLFREPLWAQLGPGAQSPYYRPLFSVLMLTEYSLFGANPAPWHGVNIALHVLVTLTLFSFLIFRAIRVLPALIGAALFAVSPLNAEVVSWLSGADNALYTLFVLLALGLLTLSASASSARTRMALRCSMSLVLVLALFSKETAIAGLALCLAYDLLVLNKQGRVRGAVEWTLYVLPFLIYLPMRALMIEQPRYMTHPWSVGQIFSTRAAVLLLALRKLLWPLPASEFYDVWVTQVRSGWVIAAAVGAACLLCSVMWWLARRNRLLAWAFAVMILPVLPALAAVPYFKEFDLFHDRYLYLPCAGLALCVAFALDKLKAKIMVTAAVIAVPVLAIFAFEARLASAPFQDDLSLFSNAVRVAPHNVIALQFLADAELKLGDCSQALGYYTRGAQLRPDLWQPSFSLGIGSLRCGRVSNAVPAFKGAAAAPLAEPQQAALAFYELGRALLTQRDLPGAEGALRQAAVLDPASHKVRAVLSQVMQAEGKLAPPSL